MKPVMVGDPPNQKLRVGFVAKKPIQQGEELFFNYGLREKNISWAVTDAKKVAKQLPSLKTSKHKISPPKKVTYYIASFLWGDFKNLEKCFMNLQGLALALTEKLG